MSAELPRAVVDAYALGSEGDVTTSVVTVGHNATTWRVSSGDQTWAVRGTTRAGAHDMVPALLRELHDHDLAVPRPRATKVGPWTLVHEDVTYSVSEWMAGQAVAADDVDAGRKVGMLLAAAHSAVPGDVASRPGWSPLIEFADSSRVGDWSLRSGLTRLGQPQAERVTVIADAARRVDLHLHPLNREIAKHPALVHYDVHPSNVVRQPDGTVALLDWDFAHPDHRAADVAVAQRGWPQAADAILDGYESKTPLTDDELAALPLLIAARGLDHLATRITAWADDRAAHPIDELTGEIDRELTDLIPRIEPYPDERWDPRRGRA